MWIDFRVRQTNRQKFEYANSGDNDHHRNRYTADTQRDFGQRRAIFRHDAIKKSATDLFTRELLINNFLSRTIEG